MSRPFETQLNTARILRAMFVEQIAELEGMNRWQRRRTERGRDLTARKQKLHDGLATQTARIAALETQLASEPEQETP